MKLCRNQVSEELEEVECSQLHTIDVVWMEPKFSDIIRRTMSRSPFPVDRATSASQDSIFACCDSISLQESTVKQLNVYIQVPGRQHLAFRRLSCDHR